MYSRGEYKANKNAVERDPADGLLQYMIKAGRSLSFYFDDISKIYHKDVCVTNTHDSSGQSMVLNGTRHSVAKTGTPFKIS